ncbi:MAG: hypothetical protein ACLR8P_20395 [Clostridium fessum]
MAATAQRKVTIEEVLNKRAFSLLKEDIQQSSGRAGRIRVSMMGNGSFRYREPEIPGDKICFAPTSLPDDADPRCRRGAAYLPSTQGKLRENA